MKKRILMLVTVVALMVVMMVAPAQAEPKGNWVCTLGDPPTVIAVYAYGEFKHALKSGEIGQLPNGTVCNLTRK